MSDVYGQKISASKKISFEWMLIGFIVFFNEMKRVKIVMPHKYFLVSLFCIFMAANAHSAEITRRPDLAPRLSELRQLYSGDNGENGAVYNGEDTIFMLSGVIEKGDLEKLKAEMDATWNKVLVLDSPGGSFLEGIRIGKYLQSQFAGNDRDFEGVYVLKGHQCLSACALAFTLTATPMTTGLRFIETGAELGYHMAFLPDEKANQLVAVREAMDLAYDVTREYTELIQGGITPALLLREALSHRSADSFFFLSGGIRTYSLGMTPVSRGPIAKPVVKDALYMDAVNAMCTLSLFADSSIQKTEVLYEYGMIKGGPEASGVRLEDLVEKLGSNVIGADHNGSAYCVVQLNSDGTVGLWIMEGPLPCEDKLGGEDWCALKPLEYKISLIKNALLADVSGCHGGSFTEEFYHWENDNLNVDSGNGGATIHRDTKNWERTLGRDVNVRTEPSLKASVISQLRTGEIVKIANCRIVDGPQGVWYQLETGGWISARFVSLFNYWVRPASEEALIER